MAILHMRLILSGILVLVGVLVVVVMGGVGGVTVVFGVRVMSLGVVDGGTMVRLTMVGHGVELVVLLAKDGLESHLVVGESVSVGSGEAQDATSKNCGGEVKHSC